MQRAYHVDELKSNNTLKIDVKYYLSQQIHPVVSRLCDPIDGTDAARIAECLGLDPTSYRRQLQRADETDDLGLGEKSVLDAQERFRDCDKFKFTCMKCSHEITMDCSYRKRVITKTRAFLFFGNKYKFLRPLLFIIWFQDDGCHELLLEKCINPDCDLAPMQHLAPIQNALTLAIRSYIQRYYAVIYLFNVCLDCT